MSVEASIFQLLSSDRKDERKGYVAPHTDRCQSPIEDKPTCQRQQGASTEIMGPERKAERTWHFTMLRQLFVVRSYNANACIPDVTISSLS